MIQETENDKRQKAVVASWDRCKHEYRLTPGATYPIHRLQSSEIAPRLEALVELTGGRQGIFRQVSEIALNAGHCLAISDNDRIIVRLESMSNERARFERSGIAVGSCWNERIAGTNGLAMAMSQGEAFTVRGKEHFFAKLQHFACTAVPLLDAHNNIIGAANLSAIDHGNAAEYLFQQQLLEQAVRKLQHVVFEQHFSNSLILSISAPTTIGLLSNNELIAVDNSGVVCGATNKAGNLPNGKNTNELNGQDIEAIVGYTLEELIRNQGKQLGIKFDSGLDLNVSVREAKPIQYSSTGLHDTSSGHSQNGYKPPHPPSLSNLCIGSQLMEGIQEQAQISFNSGIPFLIEGESGTGKTAFIKSLHRAAGGLSSNLVIIDCATLSDNTPDSLQIDSVLEHARVAQALQGITKTSATLLLENIIEMPSQTQAKLRNLLETIEFDTHKNDEALNGFSLRIVATAPSYLRMAVNNKIFRDDLYYLLCGAYFVLPPLREREGLELLAKSIAKQLAGATVEFTQESLDAIHRYDWPGNIRELRNALRQSLISGNGKRISLIDLTQYSQLNAELSDRRELVARPVYLLEKYDEETRLMDALLGANWNVTRAARNLGIGRATIHRKMNHYGITRPGKDD